MAGSLAHHDGDVGSVEAVLWDVGGVFLPSPFNRIRGAASEHGIDGEDAAGADLRAVPRGHRPPLAPAGAGRVHLRRVQRAAARRRQVPGPRHRPDGGADAMGGGGAHLVRDDVLEAAAAASAGGRAHRDHHQQHRRVLAGLERASSTTSTPSSSWSSTPPPSACASPTRPSSTWPSNSSEGSPPKRPSSWTTPPATSSPPRPSASTPSSSRTTTAPALRSWRRPSPPDHPWTSRESRPRRVMRPLGTGVAGLLEVGEAADDRAHRHLALEAGQRRAQAEVDAGAEGHVLAGVGPADVELVGGRAPLGGVAVGRRRGGS